MNSKSEDEIFSCEVKFNDIDLVSADKSKLGNLDSWVVEGDTPKNEGVLKFIYYNFVYVQKMVFFFT